MKVGAVGRSVGKVGRRRWSLSWLCGKREVCAGAGGKVWVVQWCSSVVRTCPPFSTGGGRFFQLGGARRDASARVVAHKI